MRQFQRPRPIPEFEVILKTFLLVSRLDTPAARVDLDVLEPAIDGNVFLRDLVEGVLCPLVVDPEEGVFCNAIGDDKRHHLLRGEWGPL